MARKQNIETETSVIETRSLEEIEREMRMLVGVGYRASQRIAVLVATAKDRHFQEVPEWLLWCSNRFGYARRTAFQLAKVGGFLLHACAGSPVVTQEFMESASRGALGQHEPCETLPAVRLPQIGEDPILSCDLVKLEHLAELYEQKPDQYMGLVKHWNPAEHTREQVRDGLIEMQRQAKRAK